MSNSIDPSITAFALCHDLTMLFLGGPPRFFGAGSWAAAMALIPKSWRPLADTAAAERESILCPVMHRFLPQAGVGDEIVFYSAELRARARKKY